MFVSPFQLDILPRQRSRTLVRCFRIWAAALWMSVSPGAIYGKSEATPAPEAIAPSAWAIIRTGDSAEKVRTLAALPEVGGLIYYTTLRTIEPKEGEFDWSGIDRVLDICRSTGKPLKLAILGGRWVPEWLYERGAQRFTWTHDTAYVEAGRSEASAPVPWDETYLTAMEAALSACGQRYGTRDELVEVQITGPALANGLEMNMSVSPADGRKIGYSFEKLANAWKRMMNAYARAFPRQSLSLALHNDLFGERTDALASEVRDYGLSTYGNRLHLLICYATYETWFQKGNSAVDMWADVPPPTEKEAQLIDLFSVKNAPLEKVAEAIRKAVNLGAVRIEVFSDDLYSEKYRQAIAQTLAEFHRKPNL